MGRNTSPAAGAQALYSIKNALSAVVTVSPGIAATDAADAPNPVIDTSTTSGWLIRSLYPVAGAEKSRVDLFRASLQNRLLVVSKSSDYLCCPLARSRSGRRPPASTPTASGRLTALTSSCRASSSSRFRRSSSLAFCSLSSRTAASRSRRCS